MLAQYAAEAGLLDTDYLARMLGWVADGRRHLERGFRDLGLDPIPSVTNFVSSPVPMSGRACVEAMLAKGIQINAWADPGYQRNIRVTVGRAEDNDACLAALAQVLAEGD